MATWMCVVHWVEHITLIFVGLAVLRIFSKDGFAGLLTAFVRVLRLVPGMNWVISTVILSQSQGAMKDLVPELAEGSGSKKPQFHIPKKGLNGDDVLKRMREIKNKEAQADQGKLFGYVYTTDHSHHYAAIKEAFRMFSDKRGVTDKQIERCIDDAYSMFSHENALNPTAFPSLRKFETEAISMVASMLNGDDECVGALTSGGTESLLMAMKTYRDRARKYRPWIKKPEVVAPITIHPAFEKAAAYFDITMVHVRVDKDYKCDVAAMAKAITPNTILLTVSAPQYPHGVMDPIEAVSDLAQREGLPLHVDGCFGGFMLPWVEKLGYPVETWDFRLPGVSSISADLHKYGWGAKGTSCLVFRNKELRSHMIYTYPNWPGGLFASPSMAGTRPGGVIAAAWAVLNIVGEDGYMKIAKDVMETTIKLKQGIKEIDGIELVGESCMTAFAIKEKAGTKVKILAVADVMEGKGWKMERQQCPDSIHFSIMPQHVNSVEPFLKDLREAVAEAEKNPNLAKEGQAGMYGMVATIPDKSMIDEFLKNVMNEIYTTAKDEQ